jgi:lactate permease
MTASLALLPCAAVVFAVMVFRLSGLAAAALSLVCALALWALEVFSDARVEQVQHAVLDSLVLGLLVGVVVFLGLLFVEISGRGGGPAILEGAVGSLGLSRSRAVILIAIGIGVALESLTGYGVSMLVTVPLLLRVVGRSETIRLALVGMSLMSWGALSVSALLGAELAGLPTPVLAEAILKTSGPVAALLPVMCLLGLPGVTSRDVGYALITGIVLVAGIAITSRWIGVEVAGVGGGLAVMIFAIASAGSREGLARNLLSPAMLPYALLILAVVLQKLAIPYLNAMGLAVTIETDRVSFRVIETPGIALLVVSLISVMIVSRSSSGMAVATLLPRVSARAWRPLVAIFLFLLTARILVETGGIGALAEMLSRLGATMAALVVTVLGAAGSFATGSGVTSNALFMSSAAEVGESLDAKVLFAALQHSGSAHMAMASLPVISLLIAALPDRGAGDERAAMRAGLGLAAIWMVVVIASGWTQLLLGT